MARDHAKRIKILDCTLRDGGFQNNFNWKDNFVNEYISLTNNYLLILLN